MDKTIFLERQNAILHLSQLQLSYLICTLCAAFFCIPIFVDLLSICNYDCEERVSPKSNFR
jgi:hypothetical protein